MAIRTVVTRGFGNGTFNGTIPLVVTRGYAIGQQRTPDPERGVSFAINRVVKFTTDRFSQHKTNRVSKINAD